MERAGAARILPAGGTMENKKRKLLDDQETGARHPQRGAASESSHAHGAGADNSGTMLATQQSTADPHAASATQEDYRMLKEVCSGA